MESERKGKQCPHCGIQNLQHAQTCIECKRVIDPIKLGIIIEEAERSKNELEELKARLKNQEAAAEEAKQLKKDLDDLAAEQEQLKIEYQNKSA